MGKTKEYIGNWSELAERFGISVDEGNYEGTFPNWRQAEKIEKVFCINGAKHIVELKDEDERLAQKIKRHIQSNLDDSDGSFKDPAMRKQINEHLLLIAESDSLSAPIFKAIASIENDWTMASWVCENLESLSS